MNHLRINVSSSLPKESPNFPILESESSYMSVYNDRPTIQLPRSLSTFDFTGREVDILKQMSFGLTADRIGETLFISPNTVKTHIKNMLKKSSSTNSVEMIANALRERVIF